MKVILIAIDTLRADHWGCYGYDIPKTPTTPFLDTLSEQGALFLKHYATDVPTPPSYTALFFGVRGIKNGIIGFNNPASEFKCSTPHLAACFSNPEYFSGRTGMISNLFYFCPWLVKGFHDIYPPGLRGWGGTAEEVTNESIRWLKNHGKNDFFLFAHYWDTHVPYFKRSQEKYRKMFPATEYKDFAPDMKYIENNPYLKKFYDAKQKCNNDPLEPAENLALYDANIRYVDDNISRLFANLKELGIKDEILVIITSDHGEAFGEYGFWDHYSSYRNISQLPLIFTGPGIGKIKISGYTQNVDVMPTILELAGLEVPEGLCGRPMTPLLKGNQAHFRKEIVVNSDATVVQRMFVKDDYALVHTLARPVWDHIKEYELFNLLKDPDQVNNISSEEPDKTAEMRLALSNWLAEELNGRPDPLQLSVFRGGWMWEFLPNHLEPSELEEFTNAYPELKRIFSNNKI